MSDKLGTITFTTASALAVWKHEVLGQLSHGMWENTVPLDHWKFWGRLDSAVGADNKVETDKGYLCMKTGYNIAGLYKHVGERMLGHGRMAKALGRVEERYRGASEVLHELGTLEAFDEARERDLADTWFKEKLDRVKRADAELFYITEYTMRDLRADVARIKRAMKTVRKNIPPTRTVDDRAWTAAIEDTTVKHEKLIRKLAE
jgi:hypothetical protein